MTNTTRPKLPGHLLPYSTWEFEVSHNGMLQLSGFKDAEKRGEFYADVAHSWDRSRADLSNAMDECRPLAWEVYSMYSDFREALEADIERVKNDPQFDTPTLAKLGETLASMPQEPEEGAENWLLNVDNGYFENNVVGAIREWFSETPYWGSDEEDYLPWEATAQGIAMNYFKNMDFKSLDLLGVEVVEGDDPGSPYYCAELCYSLEEANAAAEAAGLRVRFVPQRGQAEMACQQSHVRAE
jgi:hypothetical protein